MYVPEGQEIEYDLLAGQLNPVVLEPLFEVTDFRAMKFDFVIIRGGLVETGEMTIVQQDGAAHAMNFVAGYKNGTPSGVVLGATISGTNVCLTYTSSAGDHGTLRIRHRYMGAL